VSRQTDSQARSLGASAAGVDLAVLVANDQPEPGNIAPDTDDLWQPDSAQLTEWVRWVIDDRLTMDASEARSFALGSQAAPARIELSVRLVTRCAMQALNRDYRNRDRVTNVLSFPSGLPPLPLDDGAGRHIALGDLALCPQVIATEAGTQRKPLAHHWAHLVVHGVLHLLGFDHESDAQANAMESAEIRILSVAGIPNPYKAPSPKQPDE